jgi:hypothetical protein
MTNIIDEWKTVARQQCASKWVPTHDFVLLATHTKDNITININGAAMMHSPVCQCIVFWERSKLDEAMIGL